MYGELYFFRYTGWDADMTTMCICDVGYTGPDCMVRYCPKGDDPLTTQQDTRSIKMSMNFTGTSSGQPEGFYQISFHGEKFKLRINATADECEEGWETMNNIEDVTCSVEYEGDFGTIYTVELEAFPPLPWQNNIYDHYGNPPISAFTCDISKITRGDNPSCVFDDVVAVNIKEYFPCSRRGVCDYETGLCSCYSSFTGYSCGIFETEVTSSDNNDVLLLHATNTGFDGNLLHLKASSSASDAFNFIYAEADTKCVKFYPIIKFYE